MALITSPQKTEEMGSAVGQVVEQKYARIAQAGHKSQQVSNQFAALQTLHKEAGYAQQHRRAGGDVQESGTLPPK